MSRSGDRDGHTRDNTNLAGSGDSMGSMGSRQLTPAQMHSYQETTGLSVEQLEQLNTRFRALDRHQRGYLTPTDLLRIPQLVQNPLHRQIVDGFFPTCDPSARLTFAQFVETCATFMVPQYGGNGAPCRNTRAQKLRLLSKMFDTRRIGRIRRDDFRFIMRCLLTPDTEEPQSEQDKPKEDQKDTSNPKDTMAPKSQEDTKSLQDPGSSQETKDLEEESESLEETNSPPETKTLQDTKTKKDTKTKVAKKLQYTKTQKGLKSQKDPIKPPEDRPKPVPLSKEQIADAELEAEFTLLEHQAFGSLTCEEVSYEEFEERLGSANIDGRLSIAKWLMEDADDLLGARFRRYGIANSNNDANGTTPGTILPGNAANNNNTKKDESIFQFFFSLLDVLYQ
ncbi:uncharacterized protein Dana_GF21441 [Drosophila ananassae]|uniref:Uncharacterized protein n=1 Tax=Drosophila ananassae TaxID=7217 RepID=B3MSC8_DROAN|nr:uncharacterized protein LOC6504124 [Drosophila ananassae]EDV34683.2 uncharacterized protein Dana_GF21441 [Drosophila ananassae]